MKGRQIPKGYLEEATHSDACCGGSWTRSSNPHPCLAWGPLLSKGTPRSADTSPACGPGPGRFPGFQALPQPTGPARGPVGLVCPGLFGVSPGKEDGAPEHPPTPRPSAAGRGQLLLGWIVTWGTVTPERAAAPPGCLRAGQTRGEDGEPPRTSRLLACRGAAAEQRNPAPSRLPERPLASQSGPTGFCLRLGEAEED